MTRDLKLVRRTVTTALTEEQWSYLDRCASIRRCSVGPMVTALLRAVADDQLVLATLDDDSRPLRDHNGRKCHVYRRSGARAPEAKPASVPTIPTLGSALPPVESAPTDIGAGGAL